MANSYQTILSDEGDSVFISKTDIGNESKSRIALSLRVGREHFSLHLEPEQLASLKAQFAEL